MSLPLAWQQLHPTLKGLTVMSGTVAGLFGAVVAVNNGWPIVQKRWPPSSEYVDTRLHEMEGQFQALKTELQSGIRPILVEILIESVEKEQRSLTAEIDKLNIQLQKEENERVRELMRKNVEWYSAQKDKMADRLRILKGK